MWHSHYTLGPGSGSGLVQNRPRHPPDQVDDRATVVGQRHETDHHNTTLREQACLLTPHGGRLARNMQAYVMRQSGEWQHRGKEKSTRWLVITRNQLIQSRALISRGQDKVSRKAASSRRCTSAGVAAAPTAAGLTRWSCAVSQVPEPSRTARATSASAVIASPAPPLGAVEPILHVRNAWQRAGIVGGETAGRDAAS
jgi:hypothetical protein